MAAFPKQTILWQGLTPNVHSGPAPIWCSFWDASRFRLIERISSFSEALERRFLQGACIGIFRRPIFGPLHRCPSLRGYFLPVSCEAPCSGGGHDCHLPEAAGPVLLGQAPGMTVTFSAPMYPDPSQRPKAAQEDLRRRTYEFLCQVTSRPDNVEYIRYEPKEAE